MTGRPVLPSFDGLTVGVCLVCTGNICRSPIAEVVLREVAARTPLPDGVPTPDGLPAGTTLGDRLRVSSAGTGGWHRGEPMDPRAAAALSAAGYGDHGHVARQFDPAALDPAVIDPAVIDPAALDPGRADGDRVDLLVALDRRHQQTLRSLTRWPDDRIVLLRSFDPAAGGAVDVPDPYYGGPADFDACLTMIEAGCRGLADALAVTAGAR